MEAPARTDATAPVSEEQLAALREEIRTVGKSRLVSSAGFATATGTVLFSSVQLAGSLGGWTASVGMFFLVWSLTSIVTAGLLFLFDRKMLRKRFQDPLKRLTPGERQAVLLPFLSDRDAGVRLLVRPLLRELGKPAELTPAGTPEGRGAEVSGVEG